MRARENSIRLPILSTYKNVLNIIGRLSFVIMKVEQCFRFDKSLYVLAYTLLQNSSKGPVVLHYQYC